MTIPNIICEIAEAIRALPKNYTAAPKALLVGGFVRDLLLGINSSDIDIEVHGVSYGDLKKLLNRRFPGKIDERGKPFGVLKIRTGNITLDFALPRTEQKQGQGYYGFHVNIDPDLSIKKAAARRDFTINAILLDPLNERIFDPYGGQGDLKQKLLRAVNSKTFTQDPLRLYRGIQFVARFNLTVDPKTIALMKTIVRSGELSAIPRRRITMELKKLRTSAHMAKGIALAKKLQVQV